MMRAVPPVLLLAALVTAAPALAADPAAEPEEVSVRERSVLPGATLALEVRYLYPSLPCTGDWVEFDVTLENLAQGGTGPYTGSIENVIPGGTVYEPGSVSGGAVFDPESQIAETLCASGALEGRPEMFIKVVGPRPNGFLWTQVARFTPSRVVIWLRQVSTGFMRHYELDATGPGHSPSGLQDRQAFFP